MAYSAEVYIARETFNKIHRVLNFHILLDLVMAIAGYPNFEWNLCQAEMFYPICYQVMMISNIVIFVESFVLHKNQFFTSETIV